jgi:hypothetical protein
MTKQATDGLEARVHVLERAVHRLLLIVSAAGAQLAEVRHDDEGNAR